MMKQPTKTTMKKILLAGLLVGSLSYAQATSITLSSAALHGENAYEYLVSIAPGQTISSASLVFNLTLTAPGYNTFTYDLINAAAGTANTLISLPADADHAGDYFKTLYSSPTLTALGIKQFSYVGQNWTTTYDFGLNGTLAALSAAALDGKFDFGFDPDCTYTGTITFNYTTATATTNNVSVPDAATTFGLLGLSLLCLATFRHKLCIN